MADRFQAVIRRIWGFLCSRRVTVALLLAIGAVLLVGLWVPQVPGEVDAAGQAQWWSAARARFGDNTDWMARLGLFNLFRTPLFVALLAALLLNNLACTVARLGRLWRELVRRPTVRLPDAAYRPAAPGELGLSPGQALSGEQIWRVLRQRGYRREVSGGRQYFYGASPRLAPVGTLLTHVSLLLFALAALGHTQAAWRQRLILDPASGEGSTLAHRPDCLVRSEALAASRERGALPSGEAHLSIEEGSHTTPGLAAPGAPLSACGVNLHYLDAYGLVLAVDARDPASNPLEVVFDGGAALRFVGAEPALNTFAVPAWGWRVTVSPSPEAMAGAPEGTLVLRIASATEVLSQSVRVGEGWEGPWGRLVLLGGQLVELEAVYDPGVGPFLAGGVALALGSALGLLCPRRRRWARLDADGTLWIAGPSAGSESGGETAARGTP